MENNNLNENKDINPEIDTDETKETDSTEVENACENTQNETDVQIWLKGHKLNL